VRPPVPSPRPGLLGGGLAALNFSLYAAGPLYRLLPVAALFVLTVLVTAAAGLLAARTNSLLVAILGLVGACTPMFLRADEPNLPILHGYLLLLGAGVLFLSRVRPWRLLNLLASGGTWAAVTASMAHYHLDLFAPVLALVLLPFALHSSIAIWRPAAIERRTTTLDIVYLTANAAAYAPLAYRLVVSVAGRPWPSMVALAISAWHVAHVTTSMRGGRGDRPLLMAPIALGGFFAALAMPLALSRETLTLSWALMAFAFLWISDRTGSRFLRALSLVFYGWVALKVTAADWPRAFGATPAASLRALLAEAVQRLWSSGALILSLVAAFRLESRRRRGVVAPAAFHWVAALAALARSLLEAHRLFGFIPVFRAPVLTTLWAAMSLYRLRQALATGRNPDLVAAAAFLAVALTKLFFLDMPGWRPDASWVLAGPYDASRVVARLLDFGVCIAVLAAGWRGLGKHGRRGLAAVSGYGALALLVVWSTLELNSLLHVVLPALRRGGVTMLWAAFGAAFVAAGLRHRLAGLRRLGGRIRAGRRGVHGDRGCFCQFAAGGLPRRRDAVSRPPLRPDGHPDRRARAGGGDRSFSPPARYHRRRGGGRWHLRTAGLGDRSAHRRPEFRETRGHLSRRRPRRTLANAGRRRRDL